MTINEMFQLALPFIPLVVALMILLQFRILPYFKNRRSRRVVDNASVPILHFLDWVASELEELSWNYPTFKKQERPAMPASANH